MKIVFYNWNDHPDVNAAGLAMQRACGNHSFELLDNSWPEEKYEDSEIGLCVFHGTPCGFSVDGLREHGAWGARPGMIVCYVSTAPLPREIVKIETGKTTHWMIAIPNTQAAGLINASPDDLTAAWRKFIEIIQARVSGGGGWSATELEESLKEFLDPGCEALLAFRLLCEATKACDGKPDKKNAFDTGLSIHAPQDLGMWLEPFGKNPDEKDALEHVAGMIGSDKIKDKAKAVLESVTKTDTLLKSAIEEFLKEAAKSSD